MTILSIDNLYRVEMTPIEKKSLINSIQFIIKNIQQELSTRTGFTKWQYQHLAEQLNNSLNHQLFTMNDLLMLHQALNEVCYGNAIQNFLSEIGMQLSDLEKLFTTIDNKV